MEKASLISAHLEEANLEKTVFDGADLRGVYFDEGTYLYDSSFGSKKLGFTSLGNIRWGDTNLAVVKWSQIKMLGDEYKARQKKDHRGKLKDPETRIYEYVNALRANRQIAIELHAQGLSESASRFAYSTQKLRRIVLRRQKKFGKYVFSGFLDLLAGYGYHPLRTLFWYLLTICSFAVAYHSVWATYHLEKITHHPLTYIGAFVFSITAFHGHGFFLGGDFGYDSLITILAALEAVIGLVIEFSFIATFTQRFFGR